MSQLRSERETALAAVIGKKVKRASSSLESFAVQFDDESGVIFDALEPSSPQVGARIVSSDQLPELEEAVCSVDWSWIYGGKVEAAKATGSSVQLSLSPQGVLTVGAALWQGKPFLSFQPYKPAKK